jgi:hypothetical protein
MPAAVPFILGGVSTALTAKGAHDARKGQKQQLEQQSQIADKAAASQQQSERQASDLFSKRRARRSPGFGDSGAASVGVPLGGGAAPLGA